MNAAGATEGASSAALAVPVMPTAPRVPIVNAKTAPAADDLTEEDNDITPHLVVAATPIPSSTSSPERGGRRECMGRRAPRLGSAQNW